MDCAQPGTCQHGHGELWNHGHVYGNDIALFDPLRLEGIRNLADLALKCGKGELLGIGRFIALPNNCHIIATAGIDVPVDSVVRNVELASGEESDIPVIQSTAHGGVRVERFVPGDELLGPVAPKFIRILDGLGVQRLIRCKRRGGLGIVGRGGRMLMIEVGFGRRRRRGVIGDINIIVGSSSS